MLCRIHTSSLEPVAWEMTKKQRSDQFVNRHRCTVIRFTSGMRMLLAKASNQQSSIRPSSQPAWWSMACCSMPVLTDCVFTPDVPLGVRVVGPVSAWVPVWVTVEVKCVGSMTESTFTRPEDSTPKPPPSFSPSTPVIQMYWLAT